MNTKQKAEAWTDQWEAGVSMPSAYDAYVIITALLKERDLLLDACKTLKHNSIAQKAIALCEEN